MMERLTEINYVSYIYNSYCNIMTVSLCYDSFDCLQSINSHNIWVSNRIKDILCHLYQRIAV